MKNKSWVLSLVLSALLVGRALALSPWTSQPQTLAPLQGTLFPCTSVTLSSTTATQILAANATREALYVLNTTTGTGTGMTTLGVVWISSFAVVAPANSSDYSGVAGLQVIESSGTTAGSPFSMNGGAIWQGAVYGLGNVNNSVGGRVTACELNP